MHCYAYPAGTQSSIPAEPGYCGDEIGVVWSDMLVVLGGLLGSGAKTLANELAKQRGFYRYDIDRKKLRRPKFDQRGNFKILQPETDAQKLRIYESVFEEFSLLSKMYPDVVTDDAFHREAPREFFLSEARKYYDPVVFVWIESDEDSVKIRLERMEKEGKVPSVAVAIRRRKMGQMKMQPLPQSTPHFFYRVSGDERIAAEQVAALWELVQQHVQVFVAGSQARITPPEK